MSLAFRFKVPGSNFVLRPTKPAIPPGLVNWYESELGIKNTDLFIDPFWGAPHRVRIQITSMRPYGKD